MIPTFLSGESVLVSNVPYLFSKPKVGEILAFKKNGEIFIKRIVKIDNEKYFVKGDNKKDSLDSRGFGWIERKKIVGKVVYPLSS